MSPKRNRFNDHLSPFGQGNERQRSICARLPVAFLNPFRNTQTWISEYPGLAFRNPMRWNEEFWIPPSAERVSEGPVVPMGDMGCCHHGELVPERWICTSDPREHGVKYFWLLQGHYQVSWRQVQAFDLHPSALLFFRLRSDDKKLIKIPWLGRRGVNQRARCTSYNLLWLI